MKNIKIIFVDLDGTLTNSKKEISNYTSEVLKEITKKGIYVVICSGRPNLYTIEKSKIANASNFVISSNGGLIYDYLNDIKIYENEISKDILENFHRFSMENNIGCVYNLVSKRYRNKHIFNDEAIEIQDISEIDDTVSQMFVSTNEFEKVKIIEDFVSNSGVLDICNCSKSVVNKDVEAGYYGFDIALKGTNKGNAIRILLNYLGIEKNDALCFGDHINDYSMFEQCGYKVAMKNGMKELIEKADFVADGNDENGVAKFLEKLFLNF